MLRGAAAWGWPVLVVGPPPVADAEHNQQIEHLDGLFRTGCRAAAVPYVSVFAALQGDGDWKTEVHRGDGAHPAVGGYRQLTELVWPTWSSWTSAETQGEALPNRHGPS